MPQALQPLLFQPVDFYQAAVVLMIGVAGGRLVAELPIKSLVRALARKPKPADKFDHGGPWG